MKLLVWHVHGSWTTAFVQGEHTYLLPTVDDRGPWGRGRCGRPWPDSAVEVPPDELREADIDAVVLQRPEEIDLTVEWLGSRPGTDLPAVYVEHNTPRGHAANSRHPLADQDDIAIVHVTHYNELMWDNGIAPTVVIEHGVLDPGHRYTGELARAAVLINEPVRRGRIVGTDLLPTFARAAPIDLYGIDVDGVTIDGVTPIGDLSQDALHTEMARRRVYVHTARWTSLGLSLVEAMHLGMPVVAVASAEAATAVPREAGVVSTDVVELASAVRTFCSDPELATRVGKSAREYALTRFGLETFLHRWDTLLAALLP
ncbi:glycosyltransferase [Saccharomonospora viridis]|uniref:Glycosyltransferase n=2 Tax=Saccharomonospora viridis TaxID=1852 RepID=C7MZS2_SACVD|nr:glycosyltransferase [Saccharomonospora viridis]ACU96190.1 glycosyltransferase [Saccharomonospora viridis DSM 43017]KHF45304.1 glycosyl transferase [Saccharomonospora viridis]